MSVAVAALMLTKDKQDAILKLVTIQIKVEQECIPVECVPPAAVAVSPATHAPPHHAHPLPCMAPAMHAPLWTNRHL